MSFDSMMYVKETPWSGLGVGFPSQPSSTSTIVEAAKLNWEVDYLPMYTDLHDRVGNYHAIYRKDNNDVLGVVNKAAPILVQNADMFNAFDYLLGTDVEVDTAALFDQGRFTFGTFKMKEDFKILDDEIEHYFVLVNDHCKADGKVSVLNTPVRVVCQNAIETAINKSFYHLRIPIGLDDGINKSLSSKIVASASNAMLNLKERAERMVDKKIDRKYVEKLLDEFFPFTKADDDSLLHSKTNENVAMVRETFLTDCMGADNLANYKDTQWQVYNAVVDFHQHYIKKVTNAYDLSYRMKKLNGIGTPTEANLPIKYMQIADRLAA